jgi:hypothetical protein
MVRFNTIPFNAGLEPADDAREFMNEPFPVLKAHVAILLIFSLSLPQIAPFVDAKVAAVVCKTSGAPRYLRA